MDLYRLGAAPWLDSQLLYHALPRRGRSGLVLLAPDAPYVCVGYHQDVERAINLSYCEEAGIPVFRREVGGRAGYFDGQQAFFQLALPKRHELLTGSREAWYARVLQPVIEALRTLGLAAEYAALNTVVVGGAEVAEMGMAEIADAVVFTGHINVALDTETLLHLLQPAEVAVLPPQTSLTALLETPPSMTQVYVLLETHFAAQLGLLEQREVDETLRNEAEYLGRRMLSRAWLYRRGRPPLITTGGGLRSGGSVHHGQHQAPGGLVHASVSFDEERIVKISFAGNFFAYPPEAISWLEQALEGTWAYDAEYALDQVYAAMPMEVPGVEPKDWAQAIPVNVLEW